MWWQNGGTEETRGVLCCVTRKGVVGGKVPHTPFPPPPGPFGAKTLICGSAATRRCRYLSEIIARRSVFFARGFL